MARVLLEYTNFYIRFGLGRDFDPAHPTWRRYLAGLEAGTDGRAWTYRFYLTRSPARAAPVVEATFGCFSYARMRDGRLRLHFDNVEANGQSPLAVERRRARLSDLTALFAHVKQTEREPLRVVGASWLYNLEAYRRLFPPAYVASARVLPGRFRHMPLWGQFVKRDGTLRERAAGEFLDRVGRRSSAENLEECFPLQVLGVEAPVREFYTFYGV